MLEVATNETDKAFRDTVNSFRRLTLEEIQAARPLRLKVVTARAGDSASTFARRMAGVERPENLFRLLNGLGAHDAVKPGDKVVSNNGGWQLYSIQNPALLRKVDDSKVPLQAFVGPLGMPGVTAWVNGRARSHAKSCNAMVRAILPRPRRRSRSPGSTMPSSDAISKVP